MARIPVLNLALPKGRMQAGVVDLMAGAGIDVTLPDRGYRPVVSVPWLDAKLLKPQSIVEMLDAGRRDIGFVGADWVAELGADLVEVLDTGLDSVRLIVAAPRSIVQAAPVPALPRRALVVASEYPTLARSWIEQRGCGDRFVRSYGSTEVLPPDDADCIIDVTSTGSTLRANGLEIVETLMTSSTRLCASRQAMEDPERRSLVEDLALLLRSVLSARNRVMIELNVSEDALNSVAAALPCMREPTVSRLLGPNGPAGYAVKAAVARDSLPQLIPMLKARGGTDLVISPLSQVVP
jgi:ATP phosphoribosyltransferase